MFESGVLFTDGACKGNPGPMSAGIIIKSDDGQVLYKQSELLGHGTNNEAEYKALLLGLRKAKEKGIKNLKVYSDSELLVKHVNGLYNVQNPKLVEIMSAIKQELNHFPNVNVSHVKRQFNQEADALSNFIF